MPNATAGTMTDTRVTIENDDIHKRSVLDAERALVASLLVDTTLLGELRDRLRPEHFALPLCRDLYRLILRYSPAFTAIPAELLERHVHEISGYDRVIVMDMKKMQRSDLRPLAQLIRSGHQERRIREVGRQLEEGVLDPALAVTELQALAVGEEDATGALAAKALAGPEFMLRQHPPVRCLIGDGWLPAGEFGLTVGATGVGKTFLSDQLAHAVAGGELFLGQIPTTEAKVLYLSLEVQSRWLQARRGTRFPQSHHNLRTLCLDDIGRPINLLAPEDEALLIGILKRLATELCFIDPIQEAHDGEENNATWHQLVRCLKRVSLATGSAIMGVHHEGYEDTRGKPKRDLDAARGGSRLPGGAKLMMRLKPDRGGFSLVVPKVSFGRRKGSIFLRQTDDGWLEPAESPEQVSDNNANKVLEALALERGGSLSRKELVTATGLGPDTVNRHLSALRNAGRVDSTGEGRGTRWFCLPMQSPASPQSPQTDICGDVSGDEAW